MTAALGWIALACFAASGVMAGVRMGLGPGLADRVAALDVALISLMGAIVVRAAQTGETAFLNLLIVIAIVGFTATVAASQFIENESGRANPPRVIIPPRTRRWRRRINGGQR